MCGEKEGEVLVTALEKNSVHIQEGTMSWGLSKVHLGHDFCREH